MKKRKLLLINPLSTYRIGLIRDNQSIYPPMSLGIIAALTPDHWEVEILDENFTRFEFREADLVGLTALTSQVTRAYEIAEVYKEKNIPTVIGGIHVSMMTDEALQYVDTVVKGEAESVWHSVLEDFEKGELKETYQGELMPMLDSPAPRIDLYHPDYAFGSVQTTRGCPMQCEFCSVHTFNGCNYRPRPVEHVVEEFTRIKQQRIYFVDDNFIGYGKPSVQRVIDICKGIIDSGVKKDWFCSCSMNVAEHEEVLEYMAKAGCQMIFLGIESELIDQLQAANKRTNMRIGIDNFQKVYDAIHKHGIAVLGAFIFGLDTDTPDTIRRRTDYILSAPIDAMQTTILTPLPGTGTYNRMLKEGRILKKDYPEDWKRYHFAEVVFQPGSMSAEELMDVSKECWSKMYDNKTLKRKIIKTLKATKNPVAATWAYASNLQYHNLAFENERERIDIHDIFKQLAIPTNRK